MSTLYIFKETDCDDFDRYGVKDKDGRVIVLPKYEDDYNLNKIFIPKSENFVFASNYNLIAPRSESDGFISLFRKSGLELDCYLANGQMLPKFYDCYFITNDGKYVFAGRDGFSKWYKRTNDCSDEDLIQYSGVFDMIDRNGCVLVKGIKHFYYNNLSERLIESYSINHKIEYSKCLNNANNLGINVNVFMALQFENIGWLVTFNDRIISEKGSRSIIKYPFSIRSSNQHLLWDKDNKNQIIDTGYLWSLGTEKYRIEFAIKLSQIKKLRINIPDVITNISELMSEQKLEKDEVEYEELVYDNYSPEPDESWVDEYGVFHSH